MLVLFLNNEESFIVLIKIELCQMIIMATIALCFEVYIDSDIEAGESHAS